MCNSYFPISAPRGTVRERGWTMPPPQCLDCFHSVLMHEGVKGHGIAHYYWSPTGYGVRREAEKTRFLSPHQKPCAQPLTCEALLAFRSRVTAPLCKTTIINQNPISQQRQLLLEWQMFRGHLQLAFRLFYSLSFPLSLILLCSGCRLLPLSAWNRHSRKCILCKLSSRCCSWFFTNDGDMARRAAIFFHSLSFFCFLK